MKILLTGASGLLGADIAKTIEEREIELIKLCKQPREGHVDIDISTEEGIHRIAELEWDTMIHSAAWRNPDECEQDHDGTRRINVWTTGKLTELTQQRRAKLLYICTDYVFPGTKPPYTEEDPPDPVNYYGKTKLAGEQLVLAASPENASLRIPLLYGLAAGKENCALLNSALKALATTEPAWMEDTVVRYPTFTGDVAEAVMLILEKKASGIYHFSGQDRTTKYGICATVSRIIGKAMDHIDQVKNPPPSEATRPVDAHLAIDKIRALGMPSSLPFPERIKLLLQEYDEC